MKQFSILHLLDCQGLITLTRHDFIYFPRLPHHLKHWSPAYDLLSDFMSGPLAINGKDSDQSSACNPMQITTVLFDSLCSLCQFMMASHLYVSELLWGLSEVTFYVK